MGAAAGYYFLFISVIGVFYMFGMGYFLSKDYEYIPVEDKVENAHVCYWAGTIYLIGAISCIIYIKKFASRDTSFDYQTDLQGRSRGKIGPYMR
ncbi:unnamed protein product [Blepharisma stoltei]|uniref:Uncharacterized protein n=1 Tax=Blepharisma stoltei TaxID=1481888 RepID=A0AAU9JYB7_9CILI|nr:unnamed protein product [Blepharisma stoltei]